MLLLQRHTLLRLLFCLCSTTVAAQNPNLMPGYYITPQGEKVIGTLNITKWRDNILKFKSAGNKHWKKLRPADVQEAGSDSGLSFLTQGVINQGDSSRIFLLKMVDGRYSLYEGKTKNRRTLFFIQIANRKGLIALKPLLLAIQLQTLFKDCPEPGPTNPKYTRITLIRYVKALNECKFKDQVVTTFDRKFKLEMALGVNAFYYHINPITTQIQYGSLVAGEYHDINRVRGGIMAKINIAPYLSMSCGLNFIDKSMFADSITQLIFYWRTDPGEKTYIDDNYYRFKNSFTLKYLEMPIALTYTFNPYAKFCPKLTFGYVIWWPRTTRIENDWGYPFKPEGDWHNVPSGEVGHLSPTFYRTNQRNKNIFVGAGLSRRFSKKSELELSFNYFRQKEDAQVGVNKAGNQDLNIKTNRFQLAVGYYYYLGK